MVLQRPMVLAFGRVFVFAFAKSSPDRGNIWRCAVWVCQHLGMIPRPLETHAFACALPVALLFL